jgi:hypothetical protein
MGTGYVVRSPFFFKSQITSTKSQGFRCQVSGVRKKKPDGFVQCLKSLYSVIPGRSPSSIFIMFWMPDQVRHDEFGLFTILSNLNTEATICPDT